MQFQYNVKDELTQEKFLNNGGSPYVYNFAFDDAGNPTTFRGGARTFNVNNQLTGPASYAYDGNGNPTTYRGASLTYDAGDNPTSISLGAGITAGYTSEGVRAWKQTGTSRTYFLYDGTDPVVEMDGNGAVKAVNTFGLAGLVSRFYPSMFSASNSVFYTFDETGNVSQRFDGVGTLLSTHGFQAYGQYGSTSANPDPWGYKAQSGYYTDQETGLVLCTFRYYDPANGRWINRDPIGYDGGLNLYGYVGGNPVMGVDPLGLFWEDNVANAIGGWGHGLTFGVSGAASQGLSYLINGEHYQYDDSSVQMEVGKGVGMIHAMFIPGLGATKWLAAGKPWMIVSVSKGGLFGGSRHVIYEIAGKYMHGTYGTGETGVMIVREIEAAEDALQKVMYTWYKFKVPIANVEAASKTGHKTRNCATAAGGAFVRGWR